MGVIDTPTHSVHDVTLVPLPENNENFVYCPYKSENPNTSISGIVLRVYF